MSAQAGGGTRAVLALERQGARFTPFGQRQPAAAVVDGSVRAPASVLVNGGRRGLEIELAPDDLISALAARVAAIAL